MTEKEKKLLEISYSNNVSLLEIEKKLQKDKEISEELYYLLTMRDPKSTWRSTTINMVLFSGLITLLSEGLFKLQKGMPEIMFCGLSLASIICGVNKRKQEEKEQAEFGNLVLENCDITNISPYTYMKYTDTLTEIERLKQIKKQIIGKEIEIKNELENVKELTK